jgi:hypothetical protein
MRLVIAMLALVLVAFSNTAEACICVGSWSNSPIHQVPLRGSVFAYGDYFGEESSPTVAWLNEPGTTWVTKVSSTIARVDYEGTAGSALLVSARYGMADSVFVLTPALERVVPATVSITRSQASTTCGEQRALDIVIDGPAAAMRAHWHGLDGNVSDYWLVGDRLHRYTLGNAACTGTTLPASEIDAGGTLTLVAILPDGTERVIANRWFRPDLPISESDVREETPIDPRSVLVWAAFVLLLVVAMRAAPPVAIHGLTVRGHLPRLQFRVRLPRATVHRCRVIKN